MPNGQGGEEQQVDPTSVESAPGQSLDGGTRGGGYGNPDGTNAEEAAAAADEQLSQITEQDNRNADAANAAQPQVSLTEQGAGQQETEPTGGQEGRATRDGQGGSKATPEPTDAWQQLTPPERDACKAYGVEPEDLQGMDNPKQLAQKVKQARDQVSARLGNLTQQAQGAGQGPAQGRQSGGAPASGNQPGAAQQGPQGRQPGVMGNQTQPQPERQPQQPQGRDSQGEQTEQLDVDISDDEIETIRNTLGDEVADVFEKVAKATENVASHVSENVAPQVDKLYQQRRQEQIQEGIRKADKALNELAEEDPQVGQLIGSGFTTQMPANSKSRQVREKIINQAGAIRENAVQNGMNMPVREAVRRAYSQFYDDIAGSAGPNNPEQGRPAANGGNRSPTMHRPSKRSGSGVPENPEQQAAQAAEKEMERLGKENFGR